jgi:hypothetical protein
MPALSSADRLLALPCFPACCTYLAGSAVIDESSSNTDPQFDNHMSALTYLFFGSPMVSPYNSTSHKMTPMLVLDLLNRQQSTRLKSAYPGFSSTYPGMPWLP